MKLKMNKKTKKILLIALIIITVILIAVIIYISLLWNNVSKIFSSNNGNDKKTNTYVNKQEDLSDITKYSTVTDTEINKDIKSTYIDNIEELLVSKNIDDIFSLTDENFLQKYNLNRENFEKYLYEKSILGNKYVMLGVSTGNQENDVCIYRIKYIVDYKIRYVNLIETNSNEYTLNFEQEIIPTVAEHKYVMNNSGISFIVEETKRVENGITYRVSMTNNNEYDVEFNINSISGLALVMADGGTLKQTDTALTSTSGKITKNSTLSKDLYFPINMQYQNDITGMIFYNVKLDKNKTNIQINFY